MPDNSRRMMGELLPRLRPASPGRALVLLAALLVGPAAPPPAAAHGDLHEQIAAVTKRIQQEPRNAALYLKRGELHRFHRDWAAAEADYDRAAQLDPELAVVDLVRANLGFEAGRLTAAREAVDRFLAKAPEDPEGHAARARILVRLGEPLPAVEDFTRAIARTPRPRPEYYLERAEALAMVGDDRVDEALRGLDEGMERLGPVVTLQLAAIDLEVKRRRYDAALARLQRAQDASLRRETWLARKAEILAQAGRASEAREAYEAALAELATLPPHRRAVKATLELEQRIRTALAMLPARAGEEQP